MASRNRWKCSTSSNDFRTDGLRPRRVISAPVSRATATGMAHHARMDMRVTSVRSVAPRVTCALRRRSFRPDPFIVPIREELMLPDGNLRLEVVDQPPAGREGLRTMGAGGG